MKMLFTFIALGVVSVASLTHAAIIRGTGAPTTPLDNTSNPTRTSDNGDAQNFREASATGIALQSGQDILKLTFWGRYSDEALPSAADRKFQLLLWGPNVTPTTAPEPTPIDFNADQASVYDTNGSTTWYQFTANFASPIPITTAGTYYLGIVGNEFGTATGNRTFGWTSLDDNGDRYRSDDGGGWFSITGGGSLAFQTEHAPEPGSIAVLSFAAVGLAFGAWRRRKKQ